MNKITQSLYSAWITHAILLLNVNTGTSKFRATPRHTEAVVGQTVALNCSIPNQRGLWRKDVQNITAHGEILEPYKDIFELDLNTSSVSFNLVIRNVTFGNAGSYLCYDGEIIAESTYQWAELTVLDRHGVYSSNMKSDGIFGPNDCWIKPDVLILTCKVSYAGRYQPQLGWVKTGIGNGTVETTVCETYHEQEGDRIICSTRINSTQQMDNSTYVCRATSPTTQQHILCTSEVVKIMYALNDPSATEATLNEEVVCSQKTSQRCNLTWRLSKETISYNMTLIPEKPGLYTCEAQCDFRGQQCSVYSFAFVSNSTTAQVPAASSSDIDGKICWLIVLGLYSLIVSIGIAIILAYKCYRYKVQLQAEHLNLEIQRPRQAEELQVLNLKDTDPVTSSDTEMR